MHTVAFSSFKGGTAKTSTALHLGACLAKYLLKKVLLIDLDSQANLSTGIGLGRDCLDAMPAVLKEEVLITDIIKESCIPNLYIAPSNVYLDGIEATTPLVTDHYSHERLRRLLKNLEFDYCFIDTPPSLGWLSQSAFYAAHQSIICATPEPYSLLGLHRLQEYHDLIQKNHSLSILGVVLTFWDGRSATNGIYVDSIKKTFPDKLFDTKIRRDIAVNHAILKGKPVIETAESCRASQDYRALSEEFMKRCDLNKRESNE
jgi:chromosome partitioning protein